MILDDREAPDQPTVVTAPAAPTPAPQAAPDISILGPVVPANAPDRPERSFPLGDAPQGGGSSPADLPNYQKNWDSGAYGYGLSPKPGKFDKFTGALEQSEDGSFLGTLGRKYQEKGAETGQMIQPDQANKMDPGATTPYTTPIDAGVLAMRMEDRRRQAQLSEWLGRNDLGGGFKFAGNLAGGFVDAPMYAAIGLATAGIGDLVAGGIEGASAIAGFAARYGVTLGEFSLVGDVQNKLGMTMGDAKKTPGEIVKENALGAGIAIGLGTLGKKLFGSGEATPEALNNGIKKSVGSLASDEKAPDLSGQSQALAERKAGVQIDPNGEKIAPTVKTSALESTRLYGATHADGTPLVHEPGLGAGVQVTDTKASAENGVARSQGDPGQVHETAVPEGKKLLDIDRKAESDYASKNSFLKQVEEKTGVNLGDAIQSGESVKDVLKSLDDYAGTGEGETKVPDDIARQIQDVAKEQGYDGYKFQQGDSRIAHVFDPQASGMEVSNTETADPGKTPELPNPADNPVPLSPEAAAYQEKIKQANYDPDVAQKLDSLRKKGVTLHPDDLQGQIDETAKSIDDQKATLQKLAKDFDEANPVEEGKEPKTNPAKEALDRLNKQEAIDKRNLDQAQRIIDGCA
jgi:flagellar biosynthesis chaperone FliJ